MDELSQKEIGILRNIVTQDAFELLQRVASSLLLKWNKEVINTETQWDAAKSMIGKEERKKALDFFMKTVSELAHHGK